jgi:hypothetical protein
MTPGACEICGIIYFNSILLLFAGPCSLPNIKTNILRFQALRLRKVDYNHPPIAVARTDVWRNKKCDLLSKAGEMLHAYPVMQSSTCP